MLGCVAIAHRRAAPNKPESHCSHRLGDRGRVSSWSGRRDSNPPRPAWEAGILPLNYSRSNRKGKQIFWADIVTICRLRQCVKLKVYGGALATDFVGLEGHRGPATHQAAGMRDQIAQHRQRPWAQDNDLFSSPQAAMRHIRTERPKSDVVLPLHRVSYRLSLNSI